MFWTLLAIVALFGGLAFVIAKVDGLAFLAPKSSRGVTASAGAYCAEGCKHADGRCPLTGTPERALNCPLWKFVEADVPTSSYGSPFGPVPAS